MKKFITCIFIAILSFSLFAESRNALLIANQDYESEYIDNLSTPIKEAEDLGKSLSKLGFNVKVIKNVTLKEMEKACNNFLDTIKNSGGIAFFHYGGHGVEFYGENYLLAVDAYKDNNNLYNVMKLDSILMRMKAGTNIVILDTCRKPPERGSTRKSSSSFLTRDLRPSGPKSSDSKIENSIIVYSTASGTSASDSIFTPELAKRITERKRFTEILDEVWKEVNNQGQNPQIKSDINNPESLFLAGKSGTMKDANHASLQKNKSHKIYFSKFAEYKDAYTFGLYATGNLCGLSIYGMWAEFNKKQTDRLFKAMLGSSYSYAGRTNVSEDYGVTYHNLEMGCAYIGIGDFGINGVHVYTGVGLGTVLTNHKYECESGTQLSSGCDFLLSLHPFVIEYNPVDILNIWATYDINFMPVGLPLVRQSFKIGAGISL